MVGKSLRVGAVVVAVLLVGRLRGLVRGGDGPPARERIEAILDEGPAPIAVPAGLPGDYALATHEGTNRAGDEAVAVQWLYAIDGPPSSPPVHVCALAEGADESACPRAPGDERLERETERHRVIVSSAKVGRHRRRRVGGRGVHRGLGVRRLDRRPRPVSRRPHG